MSRSEEDAELGLAGTSERQPLLTDFASESLDSETESNHETFEITETGGSDIIQFSASMFFGKEGEDILKVDFFRLGSMNGAVAAKYRTDDGSGIAGEHYESVSGRVVFKDGEHVKSIQIPLHDNDYWNPTKEFKISLSAPENCKLGLYLWRCRVKILNADAFPSDKFKDEADEGEDTIRKIPDWDLFSEYCKLNYASCGLKKQTLFVLVFDQLTSVALFGTLWVGVYLVDTIFTPGPKTSKQLLVPDRYTTAKIVAAWYVVPAVMLYGWESLKACIDIKGGSRRFLQLSMMGTGLAYTAESRHFVTPRDMNCAITTSAETVATGYVAALNIVGLVGRIVTVELFIVLFQPEPVAIISVLVMVIVLMVYSIFRVRVAQRAQERLDGQMALVEVLTDESCQKFRLFADYSKRSLMTDMFTKAVDDYAKEKITDNLLLLNTQYTTKLLSGFFICIYIIAMTPSVLNHELSLGVFLATITIFGTVLADAIADLNIQLMLIVDASVPLKDFTVYFNLPLELDALREVSAHRAHQTNMHRSSLSGRGGMPMSPLSPKSPKFDSDVAFKIDLIPICFKDVSFEYIPGKPVVNNINLSIPQGQLVAVTGPHKSGKTTFVELLSNILTPTEGSIFVPSHLRVLHVSREPMFLKTSLWHNLTLGLPHVDSSDRKRVDEILQKMSLTHAIDLLEEEFKDGHSADDIKFVRSSFGDWENSLTYSQKVKLNIARALISNPEVIVINRALQGLDENTALKIFEIIQLHVREKGICMCDEGRATRRPRTVFLVMSREKICKQADTIVQMDLDSRTPKQLNLTPRQLDSRLSDNSRGDLHDAAHDLNQHELSGEEDVTGVPSTAVAGVASTGVASTVKGTK